MKKEVGVSLLDNGLGKCPPIWQSSIDQHDKIQRFYINNGPHQPILSKYPTLVKNQLRLFQCLWFKNFLASWNTHLKRMQNFVYNALSLVIILRIEMMEKMHLQIRDFRHGEKSMETIVPFLVTWDLLLILYIMLVLNVVMI